MSDQLRDRVRQARGGGKADSGGGGDAPGQELEQVRKKIVTDLRKMEGEFAVALPKGMDPAQLVRDAITVLRTTHGLVEADPDTILGAVMTCAQLGLRPGVLGMAYVLPFYNDKRRRKEAVFVAGYQGLAHLAHQSGQIRGLVARTVFERDGWDFEWREDRDVLVHRPYLDGDPGLPRLYYARALLPNGGYQITRPTHHAAMLAHRDRYVKVKTGPWYDMDGTGFESMAWKTEVKRLAKLLPKSTTLALALAADDTVRTNVSARADVEKVAEPIHERAGEARTVDGTWTEGGAAADGPDWSDVETVRPPDYRQSAPDSTEEAGRG